MDVARAAEDQLNSPIERRARQRSEANDAEKMMWKESVRKHNARLRRQRQGEWYCHFAALADSLRRSAEVYERRAMELLEDSEGTGR